MNRKMLIVLGLAAALAVGLGFADAQQPDVAPPPPPDVFFLSMGQAPELDLPPGGPIEVLGLEGMHPGKQVTGAPFSATATSETVQVLGDGNRISRKTQSLLFRDSQGRFRKETTVQGFGPLTSGEPKTLIIIHDPVAGTAFALQPSEKTARQLKPWANLPDSGALNEKMKEKFLRRWTRDESNVVTEDLGKQTINGIAAQGTRRTRTIPAGQIGNDKPITVVSESWYSQELQIVVLRKRTDPRFGETNYTVTNIQQKEPEASLFSVPADYTIQEVGPRHGRPFSEHHRMNRQQAPPV